MSDDMRRLWSQALDHAMRYREALPQGPANPRETHASVRDRLTEPVPEEGSAPAAILKKARGLTRRNRTASPLSAALRAQLKCATVARSWQ